MGSTDEENGAHEELAVDVTFEDDLRQVEEAVAAYLERPDDDRRTELLAFLERLDDQIAQSEAFDTNSAFAFGFGAAPRVAVVGETTDSPVVEEVVPAEFQAQTTLVRAAKAEVREPSPAALEALRSASADLQAVRSGPNH
jgi:hypothetical protein